MERGTKIFVSALLLSVLFIITIGSIPISAYQISGDNVLINDSHVTIQASPHTIKDSGYVTIQLLSKAWSGNINVIFGFNSSFALPKSLELYNPQTVSIPYNYTCNAANTWYNYTLVPRMFACYYNSTNGTSVLIFSHSFETANATTKTAFWTENKTTNWDSIADNFNKVSYNYDGKNVWYYATDLPISSGVNYIARMYLDVMPNRAGKYDVAFYPSSYGTNIGQAISDGVFYYLDPWFNTTKSYKISENINFSNGYGGGLAYISNTTGFNFGNPNIVQAVWGYCPRLNCTNYWYYNNNTDYQLVNKTENGTLPFEVEQGNGTSVNPTQVWNNATVNRAIGIWHLTNLNDSSGNGNTVVASGSFAANASGVFGGAYGSFAQTNSYGRITTNTIMESWKITNQSTYIIIASTHNATQRQDPLESSEGGCGGNSMAIWFNSPAGTLATQTATGACSSVGTSTAYTLVAERMYFIAVTYDGSNLVNDIQTAYIAPINSTGTLTTTTTSQAFAGPTAGSHDYLIGKRADTAQSEWNGTITEVRMYNRTMTAAEINATYQTFKGMTTLGQVEAQFPDVNFTYISIQNPVSAFYNNSNVTANYTITTNTTLSTCGYKLNALANVTLSSLCQNFTFIAAEGSNTLIIYVNNTGGGYNSGSVSFTLDTISPVVAIQSPTNSTYTSTNISLSYTITDINTNSSSCRYELNGATNVTLANCINTTFTPAQGSNIIKVYANDSAGNKGVSNVSFFVDSMAPELVVISPTNTTYTSTHSIPLTYTADHSPPMTCTYKFDGGAPISLPSCANTTLTGLALGPHNVNVSAADVYGNTNRSFVEFTVFNNAPSVTITSPTNTTYTNLNISLNALVSDVDLDSCWYTFDGGSNIQLPSCQNITFLTVAGFHQIKYYANDSWNNQTVAMVNFTVFQGFNLSVFLPNGTALALWNLTVYNATSQVDFVNLSNGALVNSALLPLGTSLKAWKIAYDNETYSATVNLTMGTQQHNFTLYPMSYVYLSNTTTQLSNWQVAFVNNTATYINQSVPTFFSVSNRQLYIGNNTIIGTKSGYIVVSEVHDITNSSVFNITLSTVGGGIIIQALDENTLVNRFFDVDFILRGTNLTSIGISAIRNVTNGTSSPACFDSILSNLCFFITDAISPASGSVQILYGQGYNNATYNVTWSLGTAGTGGSGSGTITVYADGQPVYSDSITNGVSGTVVTHSYLLQINNTNATYNKAINFTITLTGTRGGPNANQYTLEEFNQVSNTAGYTYLTNNKVVLLTSLVSGYTTYDAWFRGQENYQTDYTQRRMYRLSVSPYANYSLNGYLLRDVLGYNQYFTVLDANNQPISGGLMTLGRWYSGTEITAVQCEANPSGSCALWMQAFQPLYSLLIQKTGFVTNYTQSVTFTGSPNPAFVYMQSGTTINFTSVFNGISMSITPIDKYQNSAINTTCQVIASEGNLNYINLTVYRTLNTTITSFWDSSAITGSPSGGTISIPLNANGRFDVTCTYGFVSNVSGTTQTYVQSQSYSVWIYSDALRDIAGNSSLGGLAGIIIAIGIILMIAGPIAYYSPPYGLAVGIMLFLAFAWLGMIPSTSIGATLVNYWYIVALAILTAIAILVLRSGL